MQQYEERWGVQVLELSGHGQEVQTKAKKQKKQENGRKE